VNAKNEKLEQADSASLMNMSMKLMNENSMRAVNTDTKQMMMNTSRAVAYPTYTQHHTDKSHLIGKILCRYIFFCQFMKLGKRSIFTGDQVSLRSPTPPTKAVSFSSVNRNVDGG